MSGSTFSAHRIGKPDSYFQNVQLVPAPSFTNIYGGNVGATATAAVTFAKTMSYSDEGVGGMKVAASFAASAASTIPAATLSFALYRAEDGMGDMLIATGQATLPQVTNTSYTTYIDSPFTGDQLLLGNRIYVGGTLTPSVMVASSKLKVDLVKTGLSIDAATTNATLAAMNLPVITATNSYRVNEISGLDQKYVGENRANSSTYALGTNSATASFTWTMEGYGMCSFEIFNHGTAASTFIVYGSLDYAGSARFSNVMADFGLATAGVSVGSSAAYTLIDDTGVLGCCKSANLIVSGTAAMTLSVNLKRKQMV